MKWRFNSSLGFGASYSLFWLHNDLYVVLYKITFSNILLLFIAKGSWRTWTLFHCFICGLALSFGLSLFRKEKRGGTERGFPRVVLFSFNNNEWNGSVQSLTHRATPKQRCQKSKQYPESEVLSRGILQYFNNVIRSVLPHYSRSSEIWRENVNWFLMVFQTDKRIFLQFLILKFELETTK